MNWFDAQDIINAFGSWAPVAVIVIIFCETAFIPFSVLPGDSLLFLIGLTLANTQEPLLPTWLSILLIWLAAIGGTQLGYSIGRRVGPALFEGKNGRIFNQAVIGKTAKFFADYGVRAIIIARFIPVLRAMVPMFAGVSKFSERRFILLNVIGATIWVGIFVPGGYLLGNMAFVKQHLELVILTVVVLTSLPLPIEMLRLHLLKKRSERAQREFGNNVPVVDGRGVGLET